MSGLFTSLQQSGLLPMAAALAVVGLAALLLAGTAKRRSSASGRLRELEALREGRPPNLRYRATNLSRVNEEGEEEHYLPVISDLLKGLSSLVGAMPLLGAKDRDKLREQLRRAGLRSDDALGLFVAAKTTASVLGLIIAFGLVGWFNLFPDSLLIRLGCGLLGALVGSMVPDFVLKQMIKARQVKILRALPDALDLMVICTEAGLSLDPTVERVARELRLSSPDLARELALMSHEMRILPKREMALANFAERNDYREIQSLMSTLIQTLRFGTSLAHSLRVLATETRNARMLSVEERAAKLPAMMTVPLILFMLPAIFMVIGGPAISQVIKLFGR